jgi:hypothetical protein
LNIFDYQDFLESLLIPDIKSDAELQELLIESEDVKKIIEALDVNTRNLQDLGENIPRIMTSEEWKSQ